MAKRDFITEIVSVKSRTELNGRSELRSRLLDIDNAVTEYLSRNNAHENELLKFVPIALVACIESFFRAVVAELIDSGEPYSENVLKFNQNTNIKFDFNIVNAIQKQKITVGDFISHFLPCNNVHDFNTNLSVLLGKDLLKELKKFEKVYVLDLKYRPDRFINDFPDIIRSLNRTFELRHIFCHEFATGFKVEKDEILRHFENCKCFMVHTSEYIFHLLYPDAPVTQLDMNVRAEEDFRKAEEELCRVIEAIKTKESFSELAFIFNRDENQFDNLISIWKEYREKQAVFKSDIFSGGSLQALMYNYEMTRITEEKITEFRNEFLDHGSP